MAGTFSSLVRKPFGRMQLALPSADEDAWPVENIGRRGAPRLRLSLPAHIIMTSHTKRCILLDVSRTGAQISLESPIAINEAGFLRFGDFEAFVFVVRTSIGLNGLEFEVPVEDSDILAIRHFAEGFEMEECRKWRAEARKWVSGG